MQAAAQLAAASACAAAAGGASARGGSECCAYAAAGRALEGGIECESTCWGVGGVRLRRAGVVQGRRFVGLGFCEVGTLGSWELGAQRRALRGAALMPLLAEPLGAALNVSKQEGPVGFGAGRVLGVVGLEVELEGGAKHAGWAGRQAGGEECRSRAAAGRTPERGTECEWSFVVLGLILRLVCIWAKGKLWWGPGRQQGVPY